MGRMVSGRITSFDWFLAMSANAQSRFGTMIVGASLLLGAVFICAGFDKIRDPPQFADSIAAFAILPSALVNLLALGLPPFEIASGLLMLTARTRRIAALAIALSSSVFFLALLSALVRGLTLDCGCFGSGTPSRPRMWVELGLDIILLAGAAMVYYSSLADSLDNRLR
jgi:putative oxidoreductase